VRVFFKISGLIDWNAIEKPSRAVREYLDAIDGAEEPDEARKTPKVVSPPIRPQHGQQRRISACSSAMASTI
jgi:hypothetical protein